MTPPYPYPTYPATDPDVLIGQAIGWGLALLLVVCILVLCWVRNHEEKKDQKKNEK